MSLKVTTDIQCDADGCTETAHVDVLAPTFASREARARARRLGWTYHTNNGGSVRHWTDYCPEHSNTDPPKDRP